MKRLSFLTHGRYLANNLDVLLIQVLSAAPGYVLSIMAYLHVLSTVMLTDLYTPHVGWYQSVGI